MVRKKLLISTVLAAMLIPAAAFAQGYDWRDHAAPFDYTFGNHIDTHQQSMLNGGGHLEGFLYITPDGVNEDDGIQTANHGNCQENPDACSVGWILHGLQYVAEYCGHNSGEHPTWAIPSQDLPRQRGFTHFHWENVSEHHDGLTPGNTYNGALLKLTAIDSFWFGHHGSFLVTPGIDFDTHANVIDGCEDFVPAGSGHTDH